MHFDLKNIKEFLPYFGTILILFGYLKMSLFYSHFNINISEYVDFTEMITAFIPDLALFFFMYFFIHIFDFISKSQQEMDFDKEKDLKIVNNASSIQRIKEFFKQNIILFIAILGTIILNLFFDLSIKENIYSLSLFVILLIKFLFLEYNRKHKILYNSYLSALLQNIISLVLINIVFVYFLTIHEIYDVKNNNTTAVLFNVSEKKIQSNGSFIFVGQTNKYLFMYDKKVKETFIFKREEIKNMSIRKIEKR